MHARWLEPAAAGLLVLGAFVAHPAVSAAQQDAERVTFYLVSHTVVATDTVLSERSTRTASTLDGEMLASTGARSTYRAELASSGLVSRLEMHAYRSAADTTGASVSFVLGGDSIVARLGSAAPAHIPGIMDALAIINPSMASFEQMLIRAKAVSAVAVAVGNKVGIPLFVVGAPSVISLTVTWIGADSALIEYANVVVRCAVSPTGRLLGAVIPANNLTIVRGAPVATLANARPDYSAPQGAPYTAEEVVVHTASGLRLNGTLTIPRGRVGGRAPAVLTVKGTGPTDRDEQPQTGLHGYRPFRELADSLGRRGIAMLRLDDRGVNGSDGGASSPTTSDYADDARAAIAFLRSRPEIDGARIALVAHSEGGLVAPVVAASDSVVRAIVLMAATASPGREIVRSQQRYLIDTVQALTGAKRDSALARSEHAMDSTAARLPWFKVFAEYDPSVVVRTVRTPVLILHGLTDHQVPASEADKLADAFRAAGNTRVVEQKFSATNHLFVADETGSFDYGKLASLRVRPAVLTTIVDWLSAQFR